VKPILDLMLNFNCLLGRHSAVTLPAHQYRIVLVKEGFVLILDGATRRIQEEDKDKTQKTYYCTIRTSLPHLETLLANPAPAKVMPLMVRGQIQVEPDVPHILGLAMALNDILTAERAYKEHRAP